MISALAGMVFPLAFKDLQVNLLPTCNKVRQEKESVEKLGEKGNLSESVRI